MQKNEPGLRACWVQIHLWLGLTLGVLGVLIGISGSLLVFDHDIDAIFNPQRYAVSGPQVALSYSAYAANAAQALEGRGRAAFVRLPEEAGMPVVVIVRGRGDGGGNFRVYIDPPTGRVLDTVPGGGFFGWLHSFHENLTLREYYGREIIGAVGIAMLISSLSGLYLWWPTRGRWREALGFRRGLTATRNLHYVCGFYGFIVLAMLSFTGFSSRIRRPDAPPSPPSRRFRHRHATSRPRPRRKAPKHCRSTPQSTSRRHCIPWRQFGASACPTARAEPTVSI